MLSRHVDGSTGVKLSSNRATHAFPKMSSSRWSWMLAASAVTACAQPPSHAPDAAPPQDAVKTFAEADGVLFFNGYGAAPVFVPNHNTEVVHVPLSARVTGGFVLYVAPRSGLLVPGWLEVHAWVFDATGSRQLGRTRRILEEITFDESGWSPSEDDYLIAGACRSGVFSTIEPDGPFIVRVHAEDQLGTLVRADVRVQPSCAIANGWNDGTNHLPRTAPSIVRRSDWRRSSRACRFATARRGRGRARAPSR